MQGDKSDGNLRLQMHEDRAMLQFNIYVTRNIINDAMQCEINATNERTKGYTSLRSITNLKRKLS